MLKKLISLIIVLFLWICSMSVFATDTGTDWETLYRAKMEEIIAGYKNGTKYDGGLGFWFDSFSVESCSYFSVQDINFDGIPELYHAICGMFELEPSIAGNEEIYYIKDGKVVQGSIEYGSDFCLIPMYSGRKAEPGDVTASRWQYIMRNRESGEICFITNDSYSGFVDFPPITYSKLYFDSTSGVLKSDVILHLEMESYTSPVYLQGYDYVGADCYTSLSSDGWGIYDWKPGYLAPNVVVNGGKIEFDVQPQIINDRTMVPLRAIFERLGAAVSWDDATKTVTALKDDVTINMTVGADYFMKNGETIALDSPVTIIGSRTLVPVRAVAESFGSVVGWDSVTRTVTINDATAQKVATGTKDERKMDAATIKALLDSQMSFNEFVSKQEATLKTLPQVNSQYVGVPGRYTVIDIDKNGTDELLVEYNRLGDTAIITLKEGEFIAYYVPYRGILSLKTDGTMDWSNGASESGTRKILSFSDEGIVSVDTIRYYETDYGESAFEVDGVRVSKAEGEKAMKMQFEKEYVSWFVID